MWIWMLGVATAGPPDAPQDVEIVYNTERQGKVRIVLAGREGDTIRVDGWVLGTLPLETELVEGLHTFKVEGAAGVVEVKTNLVVSDEITQLDLAEAVAAAAAPEMLSVQGDKPQLRADRLEQASEASASAATATAEPEAPTADEPAATRPSDEATASSGE